MKKKPPNLTRLQGEVLKLIQERHEQIRQNKLHRRVSRAIWNGMKRVKDWLLQKREKN